MPKKKTQSVLIAMLLVLLIAAVAGGAFLFATQPTDTEVNQGQQQLDTREKSQEQCNENQDCNNEASISKTVVDKMQPGVTVITGTEYLVDGVYSTTEPGIAVCDPIQLFVNASGYIDMFSDKKIAGCGVNKFDMQIKDYEQPTVEIKQDSDTLSDEASNSSSVQAESIQTGGSDSVDVCIQGNEFDTTGDLHYTVELSNTQNVSEVVMLDQQGNKFDTVNVPEFYTPTLNNPYETTFKIPEIEGAGERCYSMTINADSGDKVSGEVYTTFHVAQGAIDDETGEPIYGVEDSDGKAIYEDTFNYDFHIDN